MKKSNRKPKRSRKPKPSKAVKRPKRPSKPKPSKAIKRPKRPSKPKPSKAVKGPQRPISPYANIPQYLGKEALKQKWGPMSEDDIVNAVKYNPKRDKLFKDSKEKFRLAQRNRLKVARTAYNQHQKQLVAEATRNTRNRARDARNRARDVRKPKPVSRKRRRDRFNPRVAQDALFNIPPPLLTLEPPVVSGIYLGKLRVGDKVNDYDKGMGIITSVNADGTYDVDYLDSDDNIIGMGLSLDRDTFEFLEGGGLTLRELKDVLSNTHPSRHTKRSFNRICKQCSFDPNYEVYFRR